MFKNTIFRQVSHIIRLPGTQIVAHYGLSTSQILPCLLPYVGCLGWQSIDIVYILWIFYLNVPFYNGVEMFKCIMHYNLVSSTVPQVILLGAPATGKEAIAKMICSKLRTANLNMTSLIEESESHLKNAVLEHQERNQVGRWTRVSRVCVWLLVSG